MTVFLLFLQNEKILTFSDNANWVTETIENYGKGMV